MHTTLTVLLALLAAALPAGLLIWMRGRARLQCPTCGKRFGSQHARDIHRCGYPDVR